MDDRELLELAAKAAGMVGYEYRGSNAYYGDNFDTNLTMQKTGCPPWNPIACSKDALRLAVKLRKMPDILKDGTGVMAGYEHKRNAFVPIIELFGEDDAAATRRAIVRAAAEIGKAVT